MQAVVGIKYKNAGKVYFFDGNNLILSQGDKVIVDTSGGLALGEVCEENKLVDEKDIEEPLKKVLRVATKEDLERYEKLKNKAASKLPLIEEKVKSLKLDMNLVEAEYSFDESKITIFYTSEGRVDFRELLKVLASTLKVKIELRQIGTRDEVKMVGGLGLCGMPCCCTRFLKEPEHVTVKMVKNQNLSMSPTKTGGLCGRMMCCLAYEDKQYKEMARELPAVGEFVNLPNGTSGTVTGIDPLGQKFTLKIPNADGAFKIKEFSKTDLDQAKKQEEVEVKPEPEIKEEPKQNKEEKGEAVQKPKNNKFNKKKHFKFHKKENK